MTNTKKSKDNLTSLIITLILISGGVWLGNHLRNEIDVKFAPQSQNISTNWNENDAPDYYAETGPAQIQYDVEPGEFKYLDLDEKGRTKGAIAKITQNDYLIAKNTPRANINQIYPSGWFDNKEVSIPSTSSQTEKPYNGWFYNRSHLIADSLGGDPIIENLITGTRTQNVGNSDQKGGMKYPEQIAYNYFATPTSENCPLYYAAIPQYQDLEELVPRSVTVDIQSCDKTIDKHIIVYNAAKGFNINYNTGEYNKTID